METGTNVDSSDAPASNEGNDSFHTTVILSFIILTLKLPKDKAVSAHKTPAQSIPLTLCNDSRPLITHDQSNGKRPVITPSGEGKIDTIGAATRTSDIEDERVEDQATDESSDSMGPPLRNIDAAVTLVHSQPSLPKKLKLLSLHVSRNIELWGIAVCTVGSAAVFLIYWNMAVSPQTGLMGFLSVSSHWTLFLIALNGSITPALLNRLAVTVFDKLRWKLSLRHNGVTLLDFMAFSCTTSWGTLAKLTVSRCSKYCYGTRLQIFLS